MDSITGIPKEMSGTKTPSMTSICRYCAPACSASLICSPSLLKSAAKIDGDNIFISSLLDSCSGEAPVLQRNASCFQKASPAACAPHVPQGLF